MNTDRVYYLDEDITETFTITAPSKDQVYNYRVEDFEGAVCFIGQVYVLAGTTTVTVNIEEVLKMMRPNPSYLIDMETNTSYVEHFYCRWRTKLYNGDALLATSDYGTVCMGYRYPNNNIGFDLPVFLNLVDNNTFLTYQDFLPIYPYKLTKNFCFVQNYLVGENIAEEGEDNPIVSDDMTLPAAAILPNTEWGDNVRSITLYDLFNGATYEEGTEEATLKATDYTTTFAYYACNATALIGDEDDARAFLEQTMSAKEADDAIDAIKAGTETTIYTSTDESVIEEYIASAMTYFTCQKRTYGRNVYKNIATVEICPSRFYVQWIDRFGATMCRPFTAQDDYTEEVSTISVQKYVNKERKVYWELESKWKLRTEWLDDDIYPYFESLYVSPYIILYDSVEDKSYEVLVDDTTYTEKKWDNQHAAFNLEINLRCNKKQHIFN